MLAVVVAASGKLGRAHEPSWRDRALALGAISLWQQVTIMGVEIRKAPLMFAPTVARLGPGVDATGELQERCFLVVGLGVLFWVSSVGGYPFHLGLQGQ